MENYQASDRARLVFVVGFAALAVIGGFSMWRYEKNAMATLSPDEQVRFTQFCEDAHNLKSGDLITMKTGERDGSYREIYGLYMVEKWVKPDTIQLREGPPHHGLHQGQPYSHGVENFHLGFRNLFESFPKVTDICKKDSEGWRELMTHYALQ